MKGKVEPTIDLLVAVLIINNKLAPDIHTNVGSCETAAGLGAADHYYRFQGSQLLRSHTSNAIGQTYTSVDLVGLCFLWLLKGRNTQVRLDLRSRRHGRPAGFMRLIIKRK